MSGLLKRDKNLTIVSVEYNGGEYEEETYKIKISKPICNHEPKDEFYVGGKDELDAWQEAMGVIKSGDVYDY